MVIGVCMSRKFNRNNYLIFTNQNNETFKRRIIGGYTQKDSFGFNTVRTFIVTESTLKFKNRGKDIKYFEIYEISKNKEVTIKTLTARRVHLDLVKFRSKLEDGRFSWISQEKARKKVKHKVFKLVSLFSLTQSVNWSKLFKAA